MKLFKKALSLFMLISLLIIPITSYGVTTAVTNEAELQESGTNYIFAANLLMYDPNSQDPVQNLPPNAYYETGQEVIVSDQSPVRNGYAFSGWNTYADGSGTQYGPVDTFVLSSPPIILLLFSYIYP